MTDAPPHPARLAQPAWNAALRPLAAAVSAPALRSPLLTVRPAPVNPAFNPDPARLADLARRFHAEPRPLDRPLIILAGWRSPPSVANAVAARLIALTSHDHLDALPISYTFRGDIPSIARLACARIRRALGVASGEPAQSLRPIDVVGISMGGLVARTIEAGLAGEHPRIARLFTIGTPHRGARLASRIAPDRASSQMRADSEFLRNLEERESHDAMELHCYANLNDRMVGATNTAPHGRNPMWIPGTRLLSHFAATQDRRILLDIASRLRGEQPIAAPDEPPPTD